MQILWGIVIVALSLLCWGGQAVVCFAPATGARLGLSEAEANVEPTFWADVRGEALWDVLTLWTLVVAGVLLIIDNTAWAHFGLVGGGMYVTRISTPIQMMSAMPTTKLASQAHRRRVQTPYAAKRGPAPSTMTRTSPGTR